jgi:DNA-binding NtrC family response regulator
MEWRLPGMSRGWCLLLERLRMVASSQTPLLIEGEPGSRKSILARAVHDQSCRTVGPFLGVSCAPTDGQADLDLPDLVDRAAGGTLYLGTIDRLPGHVQQVLLALFERGLYRSGRERSSDVRIIAGTSGQLQDLVLAGRFRDDLLYRLEAVRIRVPPLREHPEDIPVLARHFLQTLQRGASPREFTPAALQTLASYHWPRNVTELRECIERLIHLSPSRHDAIDPEELATVLPLQSARTDSARPF